MLENFIWEERQAEAEELAQAVAEQTHRAGEAAQLLSDERERVHHAQGHTLAYGY